MCVTLIGGMDRLKPCLLYTWSASSSSSSSGTAVYYYGKALVDNGDARLRIGMTVQAVIVTGEKADALTVPLLAVEDGSEGKKMCIRDRFQ